MADGQRSEKPTQRRLDRARKEGNFPVSREFVSAIHFLAFVALLTSFSAAWLVHTASLMKVLLAAAFRMDITIESLSSLAWNVLAPHFLPIMLCGERAGSGDDRGTAWLDEVGDRGIEACSRFQAAGISSAGSRRFRGRTCRHFFRRW